MNSSKLILALWLGANAWAQTSPQKPVNPPVAATPHVPAKPPAPAKPPVATGVQSSNAPQNSLALAAKSAGVKPVIVQSAPKPAARRPMRRKKSVQPRPVAVVQAAEVKPSAGKAHRDPFVSPVVERVREAMTCTGTGRQCLLVGEISLRGVVRSPNGFIAVVVNGEHTYFLHENDPLADGAVERITRDAIILREHSSDSVGRPLTREVVRKIGVVPAV